ncbi:MAG: MerR family DNA-binding transcriptional regulator [Sphingomonadales bacterium]|nr:MerR family DNA-binding transcriptional regulator [Sphingomonadales bacterium]
MTEEQTYSIAQLAQEFDVTSRAIRFYEDQGLINPTRDGQSRIYNKADHARLAWILKGKSVGFSLGEIGELLNLYSIDDGRQHQRLVTLERCNERIADMKEQKDNLAFMIKELEGFCKILVSPEMDEKIKKAAS